LWNNQTATKKKPFASLPETASGKLPKHNILKVTDRAQPNSSTRQIHVDTHAVSFYARFAELQVLQQNAELVISCDTCVVMRAALQ